MAGYTVGIASETKAFKQGVETGIIKPVKSGVEALEELANQRGPERLERDLKDAQDATERLADETKDTARAIDREFRDSYRTAKRSADDAYDGMRAGARDARDEVQSTAREGAASFTGEWSDVGDVVQESLANAFSGFGPGGALVGILAAAGAGALITSLQDAQEEADRLKERFTDLYRSAAEDSRAYLDAEQIRAEALDVIFNPDRQEEHNRLIEEARRIGVDTSTYIRAMAGDEDAINVALEIGNRKRAERKDWAEQNLAPERETGERIDAQGAAMDGILGKLRDRKTLTEEGKAAAELALQVEQDINSRQSEGNAAAKRAVDERGAALQAYADRAASIPNPVLVPSIDLGPAEREISRFIAKPRTTQIEASIFYKPGRSPLD